MGMMFCIYIYVVCKVYFLVKELFSKKVYCKTFDQVIKNKKN
jgi:hypothetical protein